MLLLDGKIIKDSSVLRLRKEIRDLGYTPILAIIYVGSSERSRAYINQKKKFAEEIGAEVELVGFGVEASTEDIIFEIQRLNGETSVNGIIVQFPIPKHLDHKTIVETIDPSKDVDGMTSHSLKSLLQNTHTGFMPATARGVLLLLDYYDVVIEGKRAVVVGRSLLAGKSVALALLNRNATVTICHRFTKNLSQVTREADILVVAAGKQNLIGQEHVGPQQVVVDVGINLADGEKLAEEIPEQQKKSRLIGDVDFESVKNIVGAISPVPGGVGPMTVLSLFENLIEAAQK